MGVYANRTGKAEIVHFWLAFPAGTVVEPKTVAVPGKPGIKVFLRPIVIDLDKRGILKRLLNPYVEELSTHWIYNVGDRSRRVGIELVNITLPVTWEVHANFPWDPKTRTFTKPLAPGEKIPELGIDWRFYFPKEVREKIVWYDGGLIVFDADTKGVLTFIPIKIVKGNVAPPRTTPEKAPSCCE